MCSPANNLVLWTVIIAVVWSSSFVVKTTSQCVTPGCLAQGFGSSYRWAKSLQEGLQTSRETRKPTMLIIHKSWCERCKILGPKFATSQEILYLSQYFVMVNVIDDQEPPEEMYAPDGGYIPRILFIAPNGEVNTEIWNKAGPGDYKYFYPYTPEIAKSMKDAIAAMGPTSQREL